MNSLAQVALNMRLLKSCLSGPLYIPDQGRYVIKILESEGPTRVMGELERLSQLGAPWASAVLGYLSLLPDKGGQRHPERALELCRASANSGDPYVLFVLAWALLLDGQHCLAIKTMKKSALRGFPPANLDYVTFVWNGWGIREAHATAAAQLLRHADSLHHEAALIWRSKLYSSGKFGVLRALWGKILMPFARLKYFFATVSDPFSSRVFVFQSAATGPVLRV